MKPNVFIYRNLNKKCWSVKSLATGRVIAHMDTLLLKNAEFKVSQKGRERVLRERRKNVHAGVKGQLGERTEYKGQSPLLEVTYDPYLYESFVTLGDSPKGVATAQMVLFTSTGKVFIYEP